MAETSTSATPIGGTKARGHAKVVLRWHRSMIGVRYPSHSPLTLWLCRWGASVLEADPATYLFVLPRSTACIVVSGTATHVQLPRQLVGDRDGDPRSFLILLGWRRGFARSPSLCEKDKRCLRSKFVWYVDLLFVTTHYYYVCLVCAPIVLLTCGSV